MLCNLRSRQVYRYLIAFAALSATAFHGYGQQAGTSTDGARIITAQADGADLTGDFKAVFTECKQKGLPLWNCDCALKEFRAARSANLAQHWTNLMAGIYAKSCFDEAQIQSFYEQKVCPQFNVTLKGFKKPEANCTCFGNSMAKKILDTKTVTHSGIAKLKLAAADECPAR